MDAIERLEELLNQRSIGWELQQTIVNQARKAGCDLADYLSVACDAIEAAPPPSQVGYAKWRTDIMTQLKLFRESGERPRRRREEKTPSAKETKVYLSKLGAQACLRCNGTGWAEEERDGIKGVIKCRHE